MNPAHLCVRTASTTVLAQVMALMGAGVARGWVDTGDAREGIKTVNLAVFR